MADSSGGPSPAHPPARATGPNFEGPASLSPYPTSRLAPVHDLVELSRQIEQADVVLGAALNAKLDAIATQLRALEQQARDILEQARRDAYMHRAACRFQKRVGQIYHLYSRPDGSLEFSLLSPIDWGGKPPLRHEGSFRLEADMSWIPVRELETRPLGLPRIDLASLLANDKDDR